MQRHIITASIQEIGTGGDGVGEYQGKPVYIPKAAPGDILRVNLNVQNADGWRGQIMGIETPGPSRVNAPCPHFVRCGGCALQHIDEESYRAWKIAKVQNALTKAGVKPRIWKDPVFLPPATRRRTSLSAVKRGKDVTLGYMQERTHNILSIRVCPVLEPLLEQRIQDLKPFLPLLLPENKIIDIMLQYADGTLEVMLTGPLQTGGRFSLTQQEAFAGMLNDLEIARLSFRAKIHDTPQILLQQKPVLKNFGDLKIELPPGAFLQASAAAEETLVQYVLEGAAGTQHAADLFSGCGTFSGPLLKSGAQVSAYENDEGAVKALQAARHPRLRAEKRDLFDLPLKATELENFDTVIFDPPRAGAKAQAEEMAYADIPRVIAVSCNPGTFARDAKILNEGGYALQWAGLIDQFVWSAHVEIIALFTKS